MPDPLRFGIAFMTAPLVGTTAAYLLRRGLIAEALLLAAVGAIGAFLILGRDAG